MTLLCGWLSPKWTKGHSSVVSSAGLNFWFTVFNYRPRDHLTWLFTLVIQSGIIPGNFTACTFKFVKHNRQPISRCIHQGSKIFFFFEKGDLRHCNISPWDCVSLREDHKQRVLENTVLRTVFEPKRTFESKRAEVRDRGKKKLHKEELRNFYKSPNNI